MILLKVLRKTSKKYLIKKPICDDKITNFKLEKSKQIKKLPSNKTNIDNSFICETINKFEEQSGDKKIKYEQDSLDISNVKLTEECFNDEITTNKRQNKFKHDFSFLDKYKNVKNSLDQKKNFIEKNKIFDNEVSKNFVVDNECLKNEKITKTYQIHKCLEKVTKKVSLKSKIDEQFVNQDFSLVDKLSEKDKKLVNNDVNNLDKVCDINTKTAEFLKASNTSVCYSSNNIPKKRSIKNKSIEFDKEPCDKKISVKKEDSKLKIADIVEENYSTCKELSKNIIPSDEKKNLSKALKQNKILPCSKKKIISSNVTKSNKSLTKSITSKDVKIGNEKDIQNNKMKPNFVIKNQEYKLQCGSKMIIKQRLIANPEPIIAIKVNDQTLETNENVKIIIEKESTNYSIILLIEKLDTHLNGTFLFTASNVLGNDESIVKVNMNTNEIKRQIKTKISHIDSTEEKYVKEDEKLELLYFIKTDDLVEIQMLKNNLPLKDSNFNIEKKNEKYVVSVKFKKVSLSDGGEYICRTITKNGETNIKTLIYVDKNDVKEKSQMLMKDEVPKKKKSIPKAIKIPDKINSLYGEPSTKVSNVNITAEIEKNINFENTVNIILNQKRSISSYIKLKIPKP
ncbi:Immunoglobulin-like fold domain-containing protein [Strongyloides ratti]|uniref:Immunoglobulin-like fold domain-containing protein n=1 Tax=Strongyloides ratti TaxID=34506 RepID=A0A090LMY1_STRRB|nr:Immunoglobulin-like fold domain-containing protein [Strongyloides ratti]CEF71101.1 Immunoglobulin-like fold domain-containing protein [Strongyloides ratti]